MPIDSKSPFIEKSYHTSATTTTISAGYKPANNKHFSQSNSFHSLKLSTTQPPSSLSSKFIVGSKSSNCLATNDELIENDELIDKLFPKCRPKSKVSSSPTAQAKNKSDKVGYVKKVPLAETNHHQQYPSHNREMLNAPNVSNSSSTSTAAANNDDATINGSSYAMATTDHSSSSSSSASAAATRKNFQRLQTRRIWNFMDISPSPSPPPLSPIEDSFDTPVNTTTTTTNSHYNNNNNNFTSANSMCDSSDKYSLYQAPPEAAAAAAESKSNVTSHRNINSMQNYSYSTRNSFKMKAKFDINSLELNQPTTLTKSEHFNQNAHPVPQSDTGSTAAANVIKRSYSNLNEPQDVQQQNAVRPSANHIKQTGAHFRLDSLLLSPDECPNVDNSSTTRMLLNGIKKTNRYALDYDLNDEDDVLFSRINPPAPAPGPPSVASANSSSLPVHQVAKSKNEIVNSSIYSPVEKANELTSSSTSITSSRKSSGQELTKLKPAKSYNEMDECPHGNDAIDSIGTKSNANDNADEDEPCRDLGINERCGSNDNQNHNNLNRNRIELAGGKEIFSSSRSTRAKRRSSNCHNYGASQASNFTAGSSSGPAGASQSRSHNSQRQIQLYSVSMATTSAGGNAKANAFSAVSSNDTDNVNNVKDNHNNNNNCEPAAVAQQLQTLVDNSEEQVLDIAADSPNTITKYQLNSSACKDSKVHSTTANSYHPNNQNQFPVGAKTIAKKENEIENDNFRIAPKQSTPETSNNQQIESAVISSDSLHLGNVSSIVTGSKGNYSSQQQQPNVNMIERDSMPKKSNPCDDNSNSVVDEDGDEDEDEDDNDNDNGDDEEDEDDIDAGGGDEAFMPPSSKLYNESDYEESLIREIDEVLEKPSFLRQFTSKPSSTEIVKSLQKEPDLEIANSSSSSSKKSSSRKLEQDNNNFSGDSFIRDLHQKLDMVSTVNSNSKCVEPKQSMCNVEPNKISLNNESECMESEMESDNNSVKSISLSLKSFDAEERIARVIGSVPIAQYEGSPKRYGPKPGYPRRVLSTSSATTDSHNDYETIPINSHKVDSCADEIQPKSLSPENGSPNSTSSSSSATFSSTDIHSSSSFSCPNQKFNGFSNWNIQSRVNDKYQDDLCNEDDFNKQQAGQRKDSKVMASQDQKISCDDIVKSILSIPSGHQVDTEEDDDGDDDIHQPTSNFQRKSSSGQGHAQVEPVYTSLNFIQDQIRSNESDLPRYSGGNNSNNIKPSHSFLVDEKQQREDNKAESATFIPTTTSSTNLGCGGDQSATSLHKTANFHQNDLMPERVVPSQIDSNNKQPQSSSVSNFSSMDRNIPKSLALANYSRYSQQSQSFESTDSSYRSEKYNSKDYYYGPSDEEDTTYIYDQKNYQMKRQSINSSDNGNSSRVNGDPNKATNTSTLQSGPIGYNCLSPELNSSSQNATQSMPKMFTDLTYESPGYHSSDQGEIYSDILANEKSEGSAAVSGGGVHLVSTMPVLEDGLSSGMPSSDEMDYDDDEDGDDLNRHEHDLDDYVKEYNNRQQSAAVSGCDTSVQAANRLLNMVNGTGGSSYGYQFKGSKSETNNQPSSSYRCATKDQYGHEMSDADMAYQASHHHLNPHVHNHPILGETLRQNLSSSSYDNSKSDLSTGSGQDVANISNYNKFCLSSSQLRSSSLSNASSTTSSVSTVRNNSNHLGQPVDSNSKQSQHDGGGLSPQLGHHHYHHYYHPSQANNNRHNYPNLSSSPTSMSPNSPGTIQPIHASSGSSESSSSSSHVPASLHHHQPQPPQSQPSNSKSVANSSQLPPQSAQLQSEIMPVSNSPSSSAVPGTAAPNVRHHHDEDCDTDQETDRLLGTQRNDERGGGFYEEKTPVKRSSTSREAFEPQVLIEGVLFRARYLGSTQLVCDGQPTKATRMMQAEEAVSRIKAPEGETQPSTEVDLFISTEKIMVLNTDLKEIMMDHALRTISYIADIGDLLVLMARRRTPLDDPTDTGIKRIPKMICHVFESEEAQYIAQSIGQAFQVAYMEFLKANGIEDSSFLKEMDYQEVLNSQEIFGNELEMFAKRERQKEVIVPKQKGEILGIVIVESGWGSMLPTVVIANMAQSSPSARCGQLNIGDQIIAINGISLVGLPLSTCQAYVKNTKNQTAVKFTIVPCAPVVEVKIKRPDTKYQLGFSVQNGVICSLLRGGIAERGGVRVGHRIIEINGQSVVAVPHDRIVNLLATSVGEIHMKTMPTSMFRLLTGQESPSFM